MSNGSETKTFENIQQTMPVQMIGLNTSLKGIYKKVQKFAPRNVTCLITGETGTGKEMIAQLIHSLSGHKDAPFIKVNCASIPAELFESELFGYEKGAFTGANSTKQGLIELANNGTLFLDEIGDLPIRLQPKLLRVLQDNRLYRVGGTKEIKVDFRLISATNIDIQNEMVKRKFREDLYFRISTFTIELPPLRARQEDFEALVNFLMIKNAQSLNIRPVYITDDALCFLKRQVWTGNIRELEQTIIRALISSDDQEFIGLQAIQEAICARTQEYDYHRAIDFVCKNITKKGISIKEIQTDIFKKLVKHYGNNIQLTAQETGCSPAKIYRILQMPDNKRRTDSGRRKKIIRFIG